MNKRKPMTLDRFFELLPKEGWKLHKFSETEALIRRPCSKLTVRWPRRVTQDFFCPICTVANKLAKRQRFNDWWEAAAFIGLNLHLARHIAVATDQAKPTPLRRRLLKHCGLKGLSNE